MPVLNLSTGHFAFQTWWEWYEALILLFVPTWLPSEYYKGLKLLALAIKNLYLGDRADRECVHDGSDVFVNIRDSSYPCYYIHDHWFHYVGGSSLFLLLTSILDALKYIGLYKFSFYMESISFGQPWKLIAALGWTWRRALFEMGSSPAVSTRTGSVAWKNFFGRLLSE